MTVPEFVTANLAAFSHDGPFVQRYPPSITPKEHS